MSRLVNSLLIALATFAFIGGGIGFVAAAGVTVPGEADSLHVPLPRPGDRAVYSANWSVVGPGALPYGGVLSVVAFEWMPLSTATGPDYGSHIVAPLRTEYVFNEGTRYESHYQRETDFDVTTGRAIQHMYQGAYDGYQSGIVSSASVKSEYRYEQYQDQLAPCGQWTPIHGMEKVDDKTSIEVDGFCDWPESHATLHYAADGWERLARGRAQRFTADEDSRLHLWYDSKSPFPAKVETPLGDVMYEPYTIGRLFTLERISFVHGQASYPDGVDSSALPVAPGPVPLAARTEWGIDDAGVDVHYPLSKAYSDVMAERASTIPGVTGSVTTASEYVAAHPQAYLALAAFVEFVDEEGNHHYHWYLSFADGEGNGELDKVAALGPQGQASVGIFLPSQAGESVTVYSWTREVNGNNGGAFPPASLVPAALPRAKDLMDRFAALEGTHAPNRYGFVIECARACGHAKPGVFAAYGIETYQDTATQLAPQLFASMAIYDQIWAGEDGGMHHRWMASQSSDSIVPAPSVAAGAQAAAPPGGVWKAPSSQQAGGLGILAVLAGALYYFWPSLRALPLLGLFSRIDRGQLLEHPQRARIVDLVQAEPGIHFQELSRRLALGRGSLEHHLRKLEAGDVLVRRRAQGYVCFFAKTGTDRAVMDATPALKSEGGRKVMDALAASPNSSFRSLAAQAGLAPSTVEHHVRRLTEAGLVEQSPGSGLRLTATGQKVRGVAV